MNSKTALQIMAVVIAIGIWAICPAQENAVQRTAFFKETEAALKTLMETNSVEFFVKHLATAEDIDKFLKTASLYKDFFTLSVSGNKAGGTTQCKVHFKNEVKMAYLYRFFLSSGINEVESNGERLKTEDFFKRIM